MAFRNDVLQVNREENNMEAPAVIKTEITPPSEKTPLPKYKESGTSSTGTQSTVKKTTKSKTKPLYFWTCADVNKWLKKHCSQFHGIYGDLLLQQEVTGRTLIRMNEIKLERIGIAKAEHRNEFMQYILRLRLRHETGDLKNLDQKGTGFELKLPEKSRNAKELKEKHPP